jgi:D-alanyl-D-alanine carboxypeptidase
MKNTTFDDPSGLCCENTSTVRDLFYLARYILNNRPTLFRITKGEEVRTFGGLSFDIDEMESKNLFLKNPDLVGGKTGYIKASKYTGLFVFNLKGRNVAVILLRSEDNESDGQKVLNWLKENYFKD